ncbi:MTAP family purine nucleoside phosphorylase [Sinomonas mesophila]|uniref:MTAP family purine nucleoside phosphorylase n=1 Tax=Sinomonas mesophila TaxID=1531955 RepID=UPI001FE99F87|nr:MTAP family purine nucleoside phosphorylase [Sinomonas mesophila]
MRAVKDLERGRPGTSIAIVGGSGLYRIDGRAEEVEVRTPYGPTSGPISLVAVRGTTIAFLPRHGRGHTVAPQAVNYRANLWALKHLGVSAVFASAACGALVPELAPGTFVIPDQFIDRTWGRRDTFFDGQGPGAAAGVQHLTAADPYCPTLRGILSDAVDEARMPCVASATMAVINGPRFSTRAESRWFAQAGAHVVGMTQYPEAVLAAELGLGYATLAFVTDSDAGVDAAEAVTADVVWDRLAAAGKVFERVLTAAAERVPADYEPRALLPKEAVHILMAASVPSANVPAGVGG